MNGKKIYIIRHPQTVYNEKNIFQGRSDSPITVKGQHQIQEYKEYFSQIRLDTIFTSPLKRCLYTTHALNEEMGLPVEEKNRLAEVCYGEWEERQKDELSALEIWKQRSKNRYNFIHPGEYQGIKGESYKDLYDRLIPLWSEIKKSTHRYILIVAHQGIMIAAKKYFEQLDDQHINNYRPKNGEILAYETL